MHSWPAPQIPELPGRGLPVRVHDSSTRELVVAAAGEDATLYVCGITPYDATHIGHAATYVAFDLLVRAWTDAGHRVRYASNVTDVDDPLLERAAATGVDWRALAVEQTALFAEDMTALGVVPPDVYEGAVETIPAVVDAVTQLLDAGLAYRVPVEPGAGGTDPGLGDVYADLSADRAFGSVSRLARDVMEHLFAERGGDPDREGKKDALDPLLWRASGRASPRGTAARSAPAVPAGTWSARSSRATGSACRSTCRAGSGPAVPAPRDVVVARPHAHRRRCAPRARARRPRRVRGREDEQVARQPRARVEPAGHGRRPDGDPARAARPPLPR